MRRTGFDNSSVYGMCIAITECAIVKSFVSFVCVWCVCVYVYVCAYVEASLMRNLPLVDGDGLLLSLQMYVCLHILNRLVDKMCTQITYHIICCCSLGHTHDNALNHRRPVLELAHDAQW